MDRCGRSLGDPSPVGTPLGMGVVSGTVDGGVSPFVGGDTIDVEVVVVGAVGGTGEDAGTVVLVVVVEGSVVGGSVVVVVPGGKVVVGADVVVGVDGGTSVVVVVVVVGGGGQSIDTSKPAEDTSSVTRSRVTADPVVAVADPPPGAPTRSIGVVMIGVPSIDTIA
jgi:hypothetical protein